MAKQQVTDKELEQAKREHDKAWSKRWKIITRGFNFVMAVGMIAVTVFLLVLNADVQLGHWVLGGFSGVSALVFTVKVIGE